MSSRQCVGSDISKGRGAITEKGKAKTRGDGASKGQYTC